MATITNVNYNRKPAPRAYYAHLFEMSGVLAKIDGELVFFGDDASITTVEPNMITFLVVLGEVGLADGQQVLDQLHGHYARIACTRRNEAA
jgi:hypothetical protein